jgi:hypothetical protein
VPARGRSKTTSRSPTPAAERPIADHSAKHTAYPGKPSQAASLIQAARPTPSSAQRASPRARFQETSARIIKQAAPQQPASSTQPCILSATNPAKKSLPGCMISSFRIARQAACRLGNLSCPLHRGPFLQLQVKPQQQLNRPFRRRKFHDRGRPARKLSR